MTDSFMIPIIIVACAMIMLASLGLHTVKANNPVYIFFVLLMVGGMIALGMTFVLTVISMLSSLGS